MSKDLTVNIFGLRLKSTLILGSGPLSYGAEGMIRAHQAGAGAVATKTIRNKAACNPYPHIIKSTASSLINAEKWSDISGVRWVKEEIPKAKEAGVVVIASIGHTPEEVENWIKPVDEAGADMIELVFYREEAIVSMTLRAKDSTDKPVIVKISPNWVDPLQTALEALEHGADGITAMDSVGPVLRIDIRTKKPLLGSEKGYGWLTGGAIKPIVLRYIAEIASRTDRPIIGLGGVMTASDAVEMLMAGASAVGVCSALILKGVEYLSRLNHGIKKLLAELNYATIASVSGAALPYLYNEEILDKFEFYFEESLCTACNICVQVCPYQARKLENKKMQLDEDKCRYCGLCASICPTAALKGV